MNVRSILILPTKYDAFHRSEETFAEFAITRVQDNFLLISTQTVAKIERRQKEKYKNFL